MPPGVPVGQETIMLTFAAMTHPAKALGGASPPSSAGYAAEDWASAHGASPSTSNASHACAAHYWPCELLNAFILKMAATGHCVNAAMMLGHRPYALEQLAVARAVQDERLNALALRLRTYFDAAAPHGCAVVAEIAGA
jgi:hypothetical protein